MGGHMNIQYKYYQNNGVYINYFVTGKGDPVLFLQGGATNVLAYKEFLELLARNYMVIGADVPCFGKASVPKTIWNFTDFGNYFEGFIDSLSFKNITVIGHSFGGGIGIRLAAKSDKVKELILVDSAGLSRGKSFALFYYSFFVTKNLAALVTYRKFSKVLALVKYFFKNISRHPFEQVQVLRIMESSLLQKNLPYGQLRTKTLILWGNKDEIFSIEDAKELQRKISNSTLQIVEGNHDWCIFYPKKFYSLVREFIK